MEILLLIGIFAFVIAIIFRSNEALDRVREVEKEMKTIEEKIGLAEPPEEMKEEIQAPVSIETSAISTESVSVPTETVAESIPTIAVKAVHFQTEAVSVSKEYPADALFPKPEDIHMNQ